MVRGDTIEENMGHGGIVIWSSSPRITDCVIRGHLAGIHAGMSVPVGSGLLPARPRPRERAPSARAETVTVENCTLTDNSVGLRRTDALGGEVKMRWCRVSGNPLYGVWNAAPNPEVDAILNWWGHPTGPSGAGPGQGDAVSEYVLYHPWLPGGQPIASSSRTDPTAWNNGRKIVRDEAPPFYRVFFTDAEGVWVTMTNNPLTGPWLGPLEVWPVEMIHYSSDPAVAIDKCDPTGCQPPSLVHLVWSEHIPDENTPGEIYYSLSRDGGFTWSPPENLSESQTPSEHPSVAVDGLGVVHVVWEEWATFSPDILYRNNSVDSWTIPENISRTPMPSTYPTVEANYTYWYATMPPMVPDDRVHVAWTEFEPPPQGVQVPWIAYRSFDPFYGWLPQLDMFPEDATAGQGGAFASLIAYASVYTAGRVPAVVWQWPYEDGTPPVLPSDIYFNDRVGASWGMPRQVNAGPSPYPASRRYASLAPRAGAFGDTVMAVWEEWDGLTRRSEVQSALSPDRGAHWSNYLNLSETEWDLSLFPSLAYQKGTTFEGLYDVCWTEVPMLQAGQAHSYVYYIGVTTLRDSIYASVSLPGSGDTRTQPLIVTCYPNPATSEVTFAVSVAEASEIEVAIYDIQGREVARKSARAAGPGNQHLVWNRRNAAGQEAAPGLYFYEVRAAGAKMTGRLVLLR